MQPPNPPITSIEHRPWQNSSAARRKYRMPIDMFSRCFATTLWLVLPMITRVNSFFGVVRQRSSPSALLPFPPTKSAKRGFLSVVSHDSEVSDDGGENAIFERNLPLIQSFRQVSGSIETHHNNSSTVQKRLVRKGLEYDLYRRSKRFQEEDIITSSFDRVPGCVATVHIQTTLVPIGNTENTNDATRYRVWLNGTSDAMLSRGLLACFSEAVSGLDVSANDVLQLEPGLVSNQLHLDHVLSRGRNDGLASMMRTVQQQIRALLRHNDEQTKVNSTDVISTASIGSQNASNQKTVAMLLSGGVDSSVALNLLKRDGFNVTAFYLKIWLEDELAHLGQCPWEDDYNICKQVCQQAGVPLETISLQEEYKCRVISYTVNEAKRGRTPNPDIMCNSRVKFGCFYDAIEARNFDYVASGHYAQLVSDDEGNKPIRRLFRAPDPIKDQSYFLCALTQKQLQRVLFPIGHLQKSQVRELAQTLALPNRQRPDSQGLCFLGKVKFDEFLAAYLGERPGSIIDAASGEVLGRHRGVWYHTVGQRKGIGKVLDPQATSRGPWYVVAKDPDRNAVYVSNKYDQEAFTAARSDFHIDDIQWITGEAPTKYFQRRTTANTGTVLVGRFHFKIRHGPKLVEGTLTLDKNENGGGVQLDEKDGGLAPGQFVVFYALNGSECLGGGVISERHWTKFLLDQDSVHESFS